MEIIRKIFSFHMRFFSPSKLTVWLFFFLYSPICYSKRLSPSPKSILITSFGLLVWIQSNCWLLKRGNSCLAQSELSTDFHLQSTYKWNESCSSSQWFTAPTSGSYFESGNDTKIRCVRWGQVNSFLWFFLMTNAPACGRFSEASVSFQR